MLKTSPSPPDNEKPAKTKHMHTKRLALVIAFIAVEMLGLAGLVLAPRFDLGQIAIFAVSGAMIIVPILFAVALRSGARK